MKVIVRSLTNQKYELEVDPSITVANFKVEIHRVHNLGEPDSQKLIFSGKILKDDQTLDDAKIKDGGFVVLMTKKPAEMKKEEQPAAAPVEAAAAAAPVVAAEPAPAAQLVIPAPQAAAVQPQSPIDADGDVDMDHVPPEIADLLQGMDPEQGAEMLEQVAQAMEDNPGLAAAIIGQLVHNNPALGAELANSENWAAVFQRPDVMIQVLGALAQLGGGDDEHDHDGHDHDHDLGGADYGAAEEEDEDGGVDVELTEQEFAAVQRLEALGFDRNTALQAFLICDRNENLAANYLFDQGFH
eukprot:TRINITY_DN236_c0_g1_i2.p1 TRINITY_DN236_c0_g1~~TRINITY_DN236_c0_g1_i2.p1  ORF type:complete len:299 (-),score=117.80 TRINITY_DN236_c0_g1_i2:133-1029(-)